MERGYVKLWRRTLDTGIMQNPHALQLFMWLLLKTAYERRELSVRGELVTLEPGQVLFSRRKAAAELEVGEQVIRNALSFLEKSSFLTQKATHRFTLISLTNWHKYQDKPDKCNPQKTPVATQWQPTDNPVSDFNNLEKKNLRIKEYKIQRAPARTCARA